MDPATTDQTTAELIEAWQEALTAVADLAAGARAAEWALASPCPGWTVGDVVAHVTDTEDFLSGAPRPDHTPDFSTLPHAQGFVGQLTETGVDFRRGRTPAEVVAELRALIPLRRSQVDAVPEGEEVMGPFLAPMSIPRLMRMRTFDTWVHEQDIRTAMGRDGGWDTPPAIVAFQQMVRAVPYIWGKNLRAPAGTVLRVTVTGPDLQADTYATVDASGKGVACEALDPTVWLEAAWPDFMALACGRVDPADPALRSRIALTGDADLAAALLPAMSVTP
ncbi:MAG: maleylpyruvate isomerase family mycothiol-dependent enzyme [Actinomycetota bacterium]|nr:maleylpyruvate isomerase family mycothiol-dependent enzyme [Actinomycetota bacterium]